MYLETGATECFVKSEHDRLSNRLNKIMEGEPVKPQSNLTGVIEDYKKRKAIYYKIMEVADIKNKLATLKYILD